MSRLHQFIRRNVMMRHLSYSTRKIYTEPLIDGANFVSPAREVPAHIVRPPYVGQPNQEFEDLNQKPILQHDNDALEKLRISAKLAADTLSEGMKAAKLGNTTDDIDKAVHDYIISEDAYPTPIDYLHFPKSVCTSVNEVLCHGIPDNRVLKDGDYVNIDVTCYKNGYHGDNSAMVWIGNVHPDIQKLITVTRESLYKAIEIWKPGVPYSKIGQVVFDYAAKNGYVVCPHFTGHGIGQDLHSGPFVYHTPNNLPHKMEVGNVFTIEPIIMLHDAHNHIYEWRDGWTVVAENTPSAQWEHIIAIHDDGPEIMTLRKDEEAPIF